MEAILLGLLVGFAFVMVLIAASPNSHTETKKTCPPHKWETKRITAPDGKTYEGLVCEKCKKFPGHPEL